MKRILLVSLLLIGANWVSARPEVLPGTENQSVSQANAEMSHTEVLNDLYAQLNLFFNSKSPALDQVSKYLTPDFVFIRNSEDVSGNIKTVRWTADEYFREIRGVKDYNVKAERKIERVVFNQAVGSLANVSAVISIRYTQDTSLVAMVYAFVSHSLVKEGNEWKLKNMTTDRVAETQYVGVCPCRVTQMSPDKKDLFMAKVNYPNGSGFETAEYTIQFKGEKKMSIVTFGSDYYTWKDGMVSSANIGGVIKVEMIGKASNEVEVVTLILSKSLHKGQCSRFEPLK